MELIKIIGVESNCNTTPSTFSGAQALRVFNTTAANTLITRKDAGNTFQYTATLVAGGVMGLVKDRTDTLESNNATTGVRIVPIAFTN